MEVFKKALQELGINSLEYEVEKTSKGYRVYTKELIEIPKTKNDSYGMMAIRANGKPTSFFARAMHREIKNKTSVTKDELGRLLSGGAIEKPGRSWTLITWDSIPIGVGRFTKEGLKLEMPKDDIMRATAGFKRILQK